MRLLTVVPTPSPAPPAASRRVRAMAALLACSALLGGCDMLGIDTPAKQAARREADGRAIGAGCRHTQRSLEDCYAANPRAAKAAIFAGWREMDEYMRENDIPAMPPAPAPPVQPAESTGPSEEVVSPSPAKPSAPPATPPTGSIVPRIAPPAPATARPSAPAAPTANR
ncbi:hypothetical protein [Tepidimonas sp.]|uniref:hypothetical protein n=1 Tax=Tepidimonas sp. TaxID=2002775 RepID=UPI00391CCC00